MTSMHATVSKQPEHDSRSCAWNVGACCRRGKGIYRSLCQEKMILYTTPHPSQRRSTWRTLRGFLAPGSLLAAL